MSMRSRKAKSAALAVASSGPLMGLFIWGAILVFCPEQFLRPSHATLFGLMPKQIWGALNLTFSIFGYAGLLRCKKLWWLRAHGFAVFMFVLLAFMILITLITTGQGSPALVGLSVGLAINAWVRSIDAYKEPFHRCP